MEPKNNQKKAMEIQKLEKKIITKNK
jgi:hypothetical protein